MTASDPRGEVRETKLRPEGPAQWTPGVDLAIGFRCARRLRTVTRLLP